MHQCGALRERKKRAAVTSTLMIMTRPPYYAWISTLYLDIREEFGDFV
jgi:hypothetical protein